LVLPLLVGRLPNFVLLAVDLLLVTTAVQQVINAVGAESLGASTSTGTATAAVYVVAPDEVGSTPRKFEKGDGFKLYVSPTSAVDPTTKYNGSHEGLYRFLDDIQDRADSFGWLPILHINGDKSEKWW